MILGSVSFTLSDISHTAVKLIRSCVNLDKFFYPVEYLGLNGGYYLHPDLPHKSCELYHADLTNDIIVLLSGIVYNKSELIHLNEGRLKLSDPELIAELFIKGGPQFVENLNGDFAFLIYRPEKGECYLFRDHVGIHPLCWTINKNSLYFSSEILGLCRTFSEGNKIDPDYLLGYLKYIDYKKTPNKDVFKILPGHYLKYSEKGVEIIKYWHPEKIKIDRDLQYDQMLSELSSLVNDSVRIRSDKRFTAGAHVTGGIDSAIVAALSRKHFKEQNKFYGFSWSPASFKPENVKYDERDLVGKCCEESGIEPLFSSMSLNEFYRILSSFYLNHGFFSEDSSSELAVNTNTNLIFSGWGGDEFVSTGDRGIEIDLLRELRLRLFFKRNPLRRPLKVLKDLFSFVIFPVFGIIERETAESFRDDARYLKKPFKKSDKTAIAEFYFHCSRHQLHLNMLKFYHLQDRCENWTIMGFRKGIEYRYPLLDKRIIEYMLKIPSELLCQTDYFRPILREIGRGILPESVRLNWDKSDPVYWSWMDDLFKTMALELMKEVGEWKKNPDLHFVDFELLEKEVKEFRENRLKIDGKLLFRALVYFKAIHEFCLKYRCEI